MKSLLSIAVILLGACGGGGGPEPGDVDAAPPDAAAIDATAIDASPFDAATDATPDAAMVCPTAASCVTAGFTGVIREAGCPPVACGALRHYSHEIDAPAESASLFAGSPSQVAYVRIAGATRTIRVARYNGNLFAGAETVATVTAPGPTQGTAVLRTHPAEEGTTWVVWSEADGSIHAVSRDLSSSGPWTEHRNIASGTRPRLDATTGTLLLAYAGAGGLHLRRLEGTTWSAPTVIPGEVTDLALQSYDGTNQIIELAWRTAQQDVRFARSVQGAPFVVEDVATAVPPSPQGPAVDLRRNQLSRVAYTRGPATRVLAERRDDGTWQAAEVGQYPGAGGSIGAYHGAGTELTYASAIGVHMVSRSPETTPPSPRLWAEQVLLNHCGGGRVEVGAGDSTSSFLTTVIHTCADGRLFVLLSTVGHYPKDWHPRCLAVAQQLAATARSCGTDQACVIGPAGRRCGTGAEVDALAYAQTCGDSTVAPDHLAGCEALAGNTACVPDGDDGTVAVPTACLL